MAGAKVTIDGVQREVAAGWSYAAVDPGYFSTIGLPIISGRGFDAPGSPRVAVVSESLARWVADGGNPIGRSLGPFWEGSPPTDVYPQIIGVVPDMITEVVITEPFVAYQLEEQRPPSTTASFALRAAGDPAIAMHEAMAVAKALDLE